jgi:HEAT repeats
MHVETDPTAAPSPSPDIGTSAGGDTLRAFLEDALSTFDANPASASESLRTLQRRNRSDFIHAAVAVLTVPGEPNPGRKFVAGLIAHDPGAVDVLISDHTLSLHLATDLARNLIGADALFDVKFMRKVFQDIDFDAISIPAPSAARMLHILGEISDCSRLAPYLVQIVRHPHAHVRSKTALLLGRGNLNLNRAKDFLTSGEARVRANTVESLWDNPGVEVQTLLLMCTKDSSQRVVVNALTGLCRLGHAESVEKLIELSKSPEANVRAGAAWGMGQAIDAAMQKQFQEVLQGMLEDEDGRVKHMAERSLAKISEAIGEESAAAG